jgi:NADH dehydrogenase
MILVAGGTGTLGTQVVRRLSERGLGVRVLTRDPTQAAHLPDTVQIMTGDLRDPAAVAAAVRGCATVVSAVYGFVGPNKPSPEAIDRDANRALIQAAATAGVEHFVLVSVLGAAPDHPMSLHRAKHAAEQALQTAGVQWTIIRPAAYLETWIPIIGAKLASNGQALVFGPGRNPINFVSAADDVAVVVDLAVHDHTLRGQVLEVAGPENLTFTQLADRVITASGKPGHTRHIPLPMLRAMSVLARPVSPVFARQAQAAVVMNTTDMIVNLAAIRDRFPTIPASTMDDVLRRQPTLEVPGARGDTPSRSGRPAPSPSSEPPASSTG